MDVKSLLCKECVLLKQNASNIMKDYLLPLLIIYFDSMIKDILVSTVTGNDVLDTFKYYARTACVFLNS